MRSATWIVGGVDIATFEQFETSQLLLTRIHSSLGAVAEVERSPRQDGQTTYHIALGSQSITLTGAMHVIGNRDLPALAAYDRMRSWLSDVFAPNVRGTLRYTDNGNTWWIDCHATETPAFGDALGTYCPVTISFAADAPRWRGSEESVALGTVDAMYHEPWIACPAPMGVYRPEATADNRSMAEIYPVLEVRGAGQTVTVRNLTTGKYLTVDSRLSAGETMIVDMGAGTVTLVTATGSRSDASHMISLDSALWALRPGGNTLRVDIEDIQSPPLCTVRWHVETAGV